MRDRLCLTLVTFFGAGFSPFASGTVGSAAAVAVVVVLDAFGVRSPWLLLAMALGACAVNVLLGRWIESRFGRKDPGEVVIDEVAGQWIALAVPVTFLDDWLAYAAAFLLFRIFDILKPLGARRLEKLPRGWGILMDDVLCGIYVAAILWGLERFL